MGRNGTVSQLPQTLPGEQTAQEAALQMPPTPRVVALLTGQATPTPAQEAALTALLTGKSVTDAAAAAGVGRTTVYRWLAHDPAFQASLNQRRQEMQDALQARLMLLAVKAVDAVERALDAGNSKAALALLAGLGLLPGSLPRIGETDAAEIVLDRARDKQDAIVAERTAERRAQMSPRDAALDRLVANVQQPRATVADSAAALVAVEAELTANLDEPAPTKPARNGHVQRATPAKNGRLG
jgi:AcrR family transcriptional regulator